MIFKIILKILEDFQIFISYFHSYLFNRVNKKLFIKFDCISLFQFIISKASLKVIYFSKIKERPLKQDLTIRPNLFYNFSKDILFYIIRNNIVIERFTESLDALSITTIHRIIERINYIYTHPFIEKKKMFNSKEIKSVKEINEIMSVLKKKTIIPVDDYDVAVFYYHCGLKFVPLSIINSLKNKDFIDGGAAVGDSAFVFETNYLPRKIYAFEPDLKNLNFFKTTIKINNFLSL